VCVPWHWVADDGLSVVMPHAFSVEKKKVNQYKDDDFLKTFRYIKPNWFEVDIAFFVLKRLGEYFLLINNESTFSVEVFIPQWKTTRRPSVLATTR
jgi:hypothetical protein